MSYGLPDIAWEKQKTSFETGQLDLIWRKRKQELATI
jgi:hypothetical protein